VTTASSRIYPLCETALLTGNQPPSEHEEFAHGEKRPKDRLVASRQPKGQVDIEAVRGLICVASCQISQWTAAPIHRQDSTSTSPVRAAAHRNWRRAPATRIATMHPAKKSQIAVCRSSMPTRAGFRSDARPAQTSRSLTWQRVPHLLSKRSGLNVRLQLSHARRRASDRIYRFPAVIS